MAGNTSLFTAGISKWDEFYTRYEDIACEIRNYEEYFYQKTVLCNCDDPFESSFCRFFIDIQQ